MKTASLDLEFANNADWDFEFTVKDDGGNLVAIGGAQALMQLRPADDSSSVSFELSTADKTLVVPDDVTGKVRLKVSYTKVGSLSGDYDYDLLLAANGQHLRPYAGVVKVAAGTTRWPPSSN